MKIFLMACAMLFHSGTVLANSDGGDQLLTSQGVGNGFDASQECSLLVIISESRYFSNNREANSWCSQVHQLFGFQRGCSVFGGFNNGQYRGLFEHRQNFRGRDFRNQYSKWSRGHLFKGQQIRHNLFYSDFCRSGYDLTDED